MQTDFTIADVLEWARTKPAGESYTYGDPTNCALCHFLRDTGRASKPLVGPECGALPADWMDLGAPLMSARRYPERMEPALRDSHTFGALAQHLEKLCPETPVTMSDWARLDAYMADIELASA